jgi:alpha-galactosidase
MRKYGNMFRGVDAPNNAVANRIETANLRILSQNTAVHSDMFIWRSEETVEQAALQILNILYSVPQLSVRLAEIPDEHLEMIRHWFNYWNANRQVLIDGEFIPSNPGANYPCLTAVNDKHQITTVYEDIVISVFDEIERLDIINAKASTKVVIHHEDPFTGDLIIQDCMGNVLLEESVSFPAGVTGIEIPRSGMAILTGGGF